MVQEEATADERRIQDTLIRNPRSGLHTYNINIDQGSFSPLCLTKYCDITMATAPISHFTEIST